jgi:hypothetical protein
MQMTDSGLVLGILALVAIWFVVLWLVICHILASVSGWKRLRRLYKTNAFEGDTFRFSGFVGPSRFRGALIAGATREGLYLNVAAPFRFGIGPVLVPWREITGPAPGAGPVALVTFEFPKAGTTFRAPENVADKLLEWRRSRN